MKFNRTASNSRDLKVLNTLLVRNTIRKHGPIARRDIVDMTGLTPPTVTVITAELIKAGIVEEVGRARSSGGRKPVMLELAPDAGFIFAVRIQRGDARTALLDLRGEVLHTQSLLLDTTLPDGVIGAIADSFEFLLKKSVIPRDKVLYCGVASPGLVDPERGVVDRSSNLIWEKVPLGGMLSHRLGGIPVHVENISNAAALAEKVYGSGKGYSNLIYLNLSVGIGAGILIDGEIYGGARGYAGEVGHMALMPEGGEKCACGRHGCFEAMCGIRSVLKRIKSEVPPETFERYGYSRDEITINDIISSPLLELPEVQEVVTQTGKLTGVAVANLISLFNPQMVILGGELTRMGDAFFSSVTQTVRDRVLSEIGDTVELVRSTMKEDPPLMGVYALVLDKVFAMEEWPGNSSKENAI